MKTDIQIIFCDAQNTLIFIMITYIYYIAILVKNGSSYEMKSFKIK